MKIAIVLCSYNRKNMTERCLIQLMWQAEHRSIDKIQIYVCDDNSTDGTCEMIENEFPSVRLIKGNGNLYWSKSMYVAMKEAVKNNYDVYIMVNDDVDFFSNALEIMLDYYKIVGKGCAVVGATKDTTRDSMTYGGYDYNFNRIEPSSEIDKCYFANWNCFLIDKIIVDNVGIIDGKFQHSYGDFEYSHRMNKMGYRIYVAKEYVGKCDCNSDKKTYKDNSLGRIERLRKLASPKGVPFKSYMRYNMKVYGKRSILNYLYIYISIVAYIVLGRNIN